MRELEEQSHRTEARAEEEKERYLRITAEVDAKRKRIANDAAAQIARFRRELLGGFLRVFDDLERALETAPRDEQDSSLRAGIQITLKEFHRLIQEQGIQRIEPVGETFDPHMHEAIDVRHEPGRTENEVIECRRAGYRLGEHLLRPAQVVVNQAPRAAEPREPSISTQNKSTSPQATMKEKSGSDPLVLDDRRGEEEQSPT